jgi:uncharacterized membrane protein (DUF485 family)
VELQHHHVSTTQWDELASDPEFRALVKARRSFIVPAFAFSIVFYLALPILAGFARPMMSRPVIGPLTVAYCFALLQFLMAWTILGLYLFRARAFDLQALRCRKHEIEEIRG